MYMSPPFHWGAHHAISEYSTTRPWLHTSVLAVLGLRVLRYMCPNLHLVSSNHAWPPRSWFCSLVPLLLLILLWLYISIVSICYVATAISASENHYC